jgi:hypothetical protein
MKKGKKPAQYKTLPTATAARADAFLLLAEELGRIIGKHLADEALVRPEVPLPISGDSRKRPDA